MSSIISKLINLGGNITGVLPVVNGGTGVTTSTGTGSTVLSTSPTFVTPVLGVASSTSVTFANGATALNWYQADDSTSTTFTWNGGGSPGTSGSNTLSITRIGRAVLLQIDFTSFHATTGTGSTLLTSNTALPVNYRPSIPLVFPCFTFQGATNNLNCGAIQINTAGFIMLLKDGAGAAFPDATDCGLNRFGFSGCWHV